MNNVARNILAGRGEEVIRAKDKKDKSGPLYNLNPELQAFLNLVRLPGSLNAAHTAGLLGFKPHDIPILVARGFLTPLGEPSPNCEKFFARIRTEELAVDEAWLSNARAALNQHWRMKNGRKAEKQNGHARPLKK